MACMSIGSLSAGELLLYESDFDKADSFSGWNKRGKQEFVMANDAPDGIKRVLKLSNDPSYTRNGYGLAIGFSPKGSGSITVDYYMKPGIGANRGIFVQDKRARQQIGISLQYNKVGYTFGNSFVRTIPLENRWYHLRYVLDQKERKYDLYVDNMEKPYAMGMPYRHSDAGVPSILHIYACETPKAEILLANIRVTQKQEIFPSADLGRDPFFLSGAKKINSSPVTDGSGKSDFWNSADALELTRNDRQPVIEKTSVKLLYDDKNLYLFFSGVARGHKSRTVRAHTPEQKPWVDDSYEIFLDPGFTKKDYFQFVVNSAGTQYRMHSTTKTYRNTNFPSSWSVKVKNESDSWSLECAIPFADLGKKPKGGEVWGLNISRNNPVAKERVAFRPTDMNHRPDQFGYLLFIDNDYLKRPQETIEKETAEKFWPLNKLRSSISEKIERLDAVNSKESKKYKAELSQKEKYSDHSFLEYYRLYNSLQSLDLSLQSSLVAEERMSKLFVADSPAFKREFATFTESPLFRIERKNYQGNDSKNIYLELAGKEYGGFQLAVIPKKEHSLKNFTLSVSNLSSKTGKTISKSQFRFFAVEDVRTALPGKNQREIPDVLRPGNTVDAKGENILIFFTELCLPENTPAGEYKGKIKVDGANGRVEELTVTVRVRSFNLPSENTLGTLFSFSPEWAEQFYGKPMPEAKRAGYFDFLMEHRLDPTNLWAKDISLLTEAEMKKYFAKGMRNVMFRIPNTEKKVRDEITRALDILQRNNWMDKAIFFGFDECLHSPTRLPQMQKMFKLTKELAPNVKRLCTMEVDPRGVGYVDIWCPFFNNYRKANAQERIQKGESVWWYPTDFPLAPWPSLNLDENPTGPRMMIWISWKNNVPGLLYWATNREWVTNSGRLFDLSEKEIITRDIGWLKNMKEDRSKRWPDIPWLPFFMGLNPKSASVSGTNGGGNLMYPGPDWLVFPAMRIKNLRDGLQDHAALTLLERLVVQLEKTGKEPALCHEIRSALRVDPKVVTSSTEYTLNPIVITAYRSKINDYIEKAMDKLK